MKFKFKIQKYQTDAVEAMGGVLSFHVEIGGRDYALNS